MVIGIYLTFHHVSVAPGSRFPAGTPRFQRYSVRGNTGATKKRETKTLTEERRHGTSHHFVVLITHDSWA